MSLTDLRYLPIVATVLNADNLKAKLADAPAALLQVGDGEDATTTRLSVDDCLAFTGKLANGQPHTFDTEHMMIVWSNGRVIILDASDESRSYFEIFGVTEAEFPRHVPEVVVYLVAYDTQSGNAHGFLPTGDRTIVFAAHDAIDDELAAEILRTLGA